MKAGAVALFVALGFCRHAGAAPGEVLVDAGAPPGPPEQRGHKVHGEARLGIGFGMVMEDPFAMLRPAIELDLGELAPLQLRFAVPVRLRLFDREPLDGGVVRERDWDQPGDYVAMVELLRYRDVEVFRAYGRVYADVLVGRLWRSQLGHGTIVRRFANSLDVDRRRTGLDASVRVESRVLDQRAGIDAEALITDLAGDQVFGGRVGVDWAGAGIGFSLAGDPFAPHRLERQPLDDRLLLVEGASLVPSGDRGVMVIGLDLSYRATDDWRYEVLPYLDLNALPGIGRGLHLGVDTEFVAGRARKSRIGAMVELSVGSQAYDPGYFDVFYGYQRWQAQFLASAADRPPDFGTTTEPKYGFVASHDLFGAGAAATLRFSHDAGAYLETTYDWRPGPRGATWETRIGIDLAEVELSALYAHRGRHGFEVYELGGSVAEIGFDVPVRRWFSVYGGAGWLFATRLDATTTVAEPTGVMAGAGVFELGVAGRVPW